MEAGKLSASITPNFNWTHLPLGRTLKQRHTSDSLFLLLNLTHYSEKNNSLLAPPALKADKCGWMTAAAWVTSLSCKPAAPHLIPFPLPHCPGPPWPTGDGHNPFTWSHCSTAPMETHLELFKLISRIMFLIQSVLFKSLTKVAIINRAGGGGVCKKLPLRKR